MNNLYGWAISQKLPVNGFKWVEDLSEFNEDFIESYNEKINERSFLQVDIQYLENWHAPHNDLLSLHEMREVNKVKNLVAN